MNRQRYIDWMYENGYNDRNDWNFQEIGSSFFFWIQNEDTRLFALIKQTNNLSEYHVLVQDYNDFGVFDE